MHRAKQISILLLTDENFMAFSEKVVVRNSVIGDFDAHNEFFHTRPTHLVECQKKAFITRLPHNIPGSASWNSNILKSTQKAMESKGKSSLPENHREILTWLMGRKYYFNARNFPSVYCLMSREARLFQVRNECFRSELYWEPVV